MVHFAFQTILESTSHKEEKCGRYEERKLIALVCELEGSREDPGV
jgi:hypothetical protein